MRELTISFGYLDYVASHHHDPRDVAVCNQKRRAARATGVCDATPGFSASNSDSTGARLTTMHPNLSNGERKR